MAETNKQRTKLIKELDNHISKIESALNSMKKSLDCIQEGNGKMAYWNGHNACLTLNHLINQYSSDLDLINKIKECKSNMK